MANIMGYNNNKEFTLKIHCGQRVCTLLANPHIGCEKKQKRYHSFLLFAHILMKTFISNFDVFSLNCWTQKVSLCYLDSHFEILSIDILPTQLKVEEQEHSKWLRTQVYQHCMLYSCVTMYSMGHTTWMRGVCHTIHVPTLFYRNQCIFSFLLSSVKGLTTIVVFKLSIVWSIILQVDLIWVSIYNTSGVEEPCMTIISIGTMLKQ